MKHLISLALIGIAASGGIAAAQASNDHGRHEQQRYEEHHRYGDDDHEYQREPHEYRHGTREAYRDDIRDPEVMDPAGKASRQ